MDSNLEDYPVPKAKRWRRSGQLGKCGESRNSDGRGLVVFFVFVAWIGIAAGEVSQLVNGTRSALGWAGLSLAWGWSSQSIERLIDRLITKAALRFVHIFKKAPLEHFSFRSQRRWCLVLFCSWSGKNTSGRAPRQPSSSASTRPGRAWSTPPPS